MRCQLVDRVEGGEEGRRGQGAGDQVDGADANTNQQVDVDNKGNLLALVLSYEIKFAVSRDILIVKLDYVGAY